MRILEFITPSRIGGAETALAAAVRWLETHGDTVTTLVPQGRPIVQYLLDRGITPLTWRTSGKVDPVTLVRLAGLLRTERIDCLHAHLSTAAFLGGLAAGMAGIPSVATVHGFTGAMWYRSVGRLVAVSHAVKAHLVGQGIPDSRIAVVHNGVALNRYTPTPAAAAKASLDLDPDAPVAAVVGRLAPEKGQETAVRAWRRVVDQHPRARLLLVGDGALLEPLRALAEELELGDAVRFAGFQSDPRPFMTAADVVLLPSLSEGLPLAALEAMALGRPVIASDVGGLPEVVLPGETGLLLPAGDAGALADAALSLFANPARAADLGAAGRARVEAHFDADRQFGLLRQVLGEGLPAKTW